MSTQPPADSNPEPSPTPVEPTAAPPPQVERVAVDVRAHRRATDRNLAIGGVALLFVVGGGLIWWLFDLGALVSSWVCLGAMIFPVAAIWLALKLIDRVSRTDYDE